MDPFEDKAGNERSAIFSMSARASNTIDDDDDDNDYGIQAATISDGFRPVDSNTSEATPLHPPVASSGRPTNSPVSSHQAPLPQRAVPPPRPSSIAKPPRSHDPLILRHDGSAGQSAVAPLSRVSTASNEAPLIRSESPYEGPSGPSHPYQMYPQRTNSVATSSTARMPEPSYNGPQGPVHPYTLYPQNTVPAEPNEGGDIPVGFLGHTDNYQRRLGPDGEEIADLIGPLGHTEELPPYTRYPEQSHTSKQSGEASQRVVQGPSPSQQRSQSPPRLSLSQIHQSSAPSQVFVQHRDVTVMAASVAPIPGAGGLGLATRNPEFESREDLRPQSSRVSSRTLASDSASQHEINTAAEPYAEKGSEGRKWQKRAKRRMFGVIPYWAICLLAVGLILMGIILGAVIGTFFAKHKKPPGRHQDDEPIPLVIPTATVDIKPLATLPPDLPSMEVGIFGLPPLIAKKANVNVATASIHHDPPNVNTILSAPPRLPIPR
ncbi:hypothetical protein CTRI78_v012246 [Colletotrichum trifolii]|uniref:Uncharacterized protein n=1 Tax=Colletotrichum trifolii TaxID=5466 RepID=A0A4R8PPT6_COLTR|nr:hypothetical protein CTRI78_v012246 [Colletotrichum trifolii]